MIFINDAISKIRNNRRLQRSSRFNSTSKKISGEGGQLSYIKKLSAEQNELKNIEAKKARSLAIQFLCIAISLLLILYFVISSLNHIIPSFNQHYQNQKREYLAVVENENDTEAYNYRIKKGQRYLDSRNYEEAQRNFVVALRIKPTGKRANLGMTKVLLNECKSRNTNCDLSNQYYQNLITSGKLSQEELSTLDSYR